MSTLKLEYYEIQNSKVEKKVLEFSKELLKEPYCVDSLFVIKVEGKSMQPKINDQALVVADVSQKEFIEDAIYLVEKENQMWIKQAKEINQEKVFTSINPDFSHLVYAYGEVRVIAKALLTFSSL